MLCADDAMAILAAFNSPEVEVIGLTSLFGNVRTPMATANAVFLRELADRHDVRALFHRVSTTFAMRCSLQLLPCIRLLHKRSLPCSHVFPFTATYDVLCQGSRCDVPLCVAPIRVQHLRTLAGPCRAHAGLCVSAHVPGVMATVC